MTVPPNYGPPDQPNTPGYGFGQPSNGGQNPYGSQPQQPYGAPQFGQQPPGQQPPAYGAPGLPPEPPRRNLALIGGIIVGVTVLVLGATLLVFMNLNKDDEGDLAGEDTSESESASEDVTTPDEEVTSETETDSEVGQCLPYEPIITDDGYGDGLELIDCSDATAFWEITAQSYDVSIGVDDEGKLTDPAPALELCGEDWGINYLGELWTNWHYVYSSGSTDSLYCIQATGAADPAEPEHLPYTPDTGSCFDEATEWWSVDCSSDLATYKVVDTVVFDEPVTMDEEEAKTAATCGGSWYWQITDTQGRTSAIICAEEV